MTKPDQHGAADLDALIKQALQREYAHVDAPPPEKMWGRIRVGLEEAPAASPARPRFRRPLSWARLATVAAAGLIIAVGGLTLVRSQFSFRLGSQGSVRVDLASKQEEAAILSERDDVLSGPGVGAGPGEPDGTDGQADYRSYGSWPVAIGQSYLLKGVNAALEPARLAAADHAVYLDPEDGRVLLYISLEPEPIDRGRLLEELSQVMGAPVKILKDNYTVAFLAENGSLGLGWDCGDRMMLLVDPDGRISVEQLREIYLSLPGK